MNVRLASVVLIALFALALPAGAAADNDNYACQLMPSAKEIKQTFGLPHVIQKKNPGGGTDGENGSLTSGCGCVFATVQEEGPDGDNWNREELRRHPDRLRRRRRRRGGRPRLQAPRPRATPAWSRSTSSPTVSLPGTGSIWRRRSSSPSIPERGSKGDSGACHTG